MEPSTSAPSDSKPEQICTQFEKHWEQLCPKLSELATHLRDLFVNTSFPLIDEEYIKNIERFLVEMRNLKSNMPKLVQFSHQIKQDEFEARKKLQHLQERYDILTAEKFSQEEHICNLQKELQSANAQFENQNAYFMLLGSLFGRLLWAVTGDQTTIPTLLNNRKELIQFFGLVKETLLSFVNTYKVEMPSEDSSEIMIVSTMVRIILNITADQTGRQFVITDSVGRLLIQTFLDVLPHIPPTNGDKLKQSILKTIFNVNIDDDGALLIQQISVTWECLSRLIDGTNESSETKLISLTLLASLLKHVKNSPYLFNTILSVYSEEMIQRWFRKNSVETFGVLKYINRILQDMNDKQ